MLRRSAPQKPCKQFAIASSPVAQTIRGLPSARPAHLDVLCPDVRGAARAGGGQADGDQAPARRFADSVRAWAREVGLDTPRRKVALRVELPCGQAPLVDEDQTWSQSLNNCRRPSTGGGGALVNGPRIWANAASVSSGPTPGWPVGERGLTAWVRPCRSASTPGFSAGAISGKGQGAQPSDTVVGARVLPRPPGARRWRAPRAGRGARGL